MLFCSLSRVWPPKIHMFCLVVINSILFKIYVFGAHLQDLLCFRLFARFLLWPEQDSTATNVTVSSVGILQLFTGCFQNYSRSTPQARHRSVRIKAFAGPGCLSHFCHLGSFNCIIVPFIPTENDVCHWTVKMTFRWLSAFRHEWTFLVDEVTRILRNGPF